MTTFLCVDCDTVVSSPVAEVALPAHALRCKLGNGIRNMPSLMAAGTYAVDPEPAGPPWRKWSEVGAELAAARGVFAPVPVVSFGLPGKIVLAPGDAVGTVLIPERHSGYCCGLDGGDGPNLACAGCGRPVGTRIDDCSLWQAVWLEPDAVRRVPGDLPAPVREFADQHGELAAASGVVLAHLLVASEGGPVKVQDGAIADIFRRALDGLLPVGGPAKTVALAGPGLPDPEADIWLAPRDFPSTARTIALPDEVWRHLAFPKTWPPIPATGGFPDGVLRDDPPPAPRWPDVRVDREVFLHTLARLPAVRQPWLRDIYDRVSADWHTLRYS
ncbi:hypothetical protein SAMN05421504_101298 [Amycolatopsis xylanica]|uniref:Uncharacterized protein n=1 Tax=Amycolatopsis xylanica TaxID=589385 RepID=A0A1H2SPK5_9PSEU|nr:hypothetical protein [Amycolatopsis xylanica]SDW33566.1 hypothetical protein SAMN05421504_101298 [Amycolatopsis xylanica]